VRGFEEISTIRLGDGERQKPDCDLIIYSYRKNVKELQSRDSSDLEESYPKCIILSLKTSLRERAAQTYKWKLLLEIANDGGSRIREKYGITYNIPEIPLICFVTINFYDEINSPQQRGMLKFFDRAFLAKRVDRQLEENLATINREENTALEKQKPKEFISPLSELVDFVNQFFKLEE
jgi:type II restriction enzyme